jgi:8-oxo-dGTP pyrophosphatase MutT (NUDIX family)
LPAPLESRTVFEGRWVRVDEERWAELGAPWEIVRRRNADAAAVLAVTPRDEVILVRQFRAAVRREIEEIPAGLLESEDDDPELRVVNELREETGYAHTSIVRLGGCYPSPGAWTEFVHLFLARTGQEPEEEPEAGITVVLRPFREAVADARAGQVEDAKTALALLLADARRDRG